MSRSAKNDKTRRLKAIIQNVSVIESGKNTDLKVDVPVLDIEFKLLGV